MYVSISYVFTYIVWERTVYIMLSKIIPIIPQNKKTNFIFVENNVLNSIDLYFVYTEKIIYKNLFLITKLYIYEEKAMLSKILIICNNVNHIKDVPIFHNFNIKKFKKMSYIDFVLWIEEILNQDSDKYFKDYNYVGLSFVFEKSSLSYKNKEIYPKYPFNRSIRKIFNVLNSMENLEEKYNKIIEIEKKMKKIMKTRLYKYYLKRYLK